MKISQLNLGIKSALTAGVLAAAFIAGPAVSEGFVKFNTTGGTSCQGSSGFGHEFFYFSNTSALNTTDTAHFLTCEIASANESIGGEGIAPVSVQVVGHNATEESAHFSCALQVGSEDSVISTSVFETDVAGDSHGLIVDASGAEIPAPANDDAPYSLSCLIEPNTKIGRIMVQTPGHL